MHIINRTVKKIHRKTHTGIYFLCATKINDINFLSHAKCLTEVKKKISAELPTQQIVKFKTRGIKDVLNK